MVITITLKDDKQIDFEMEEGEPPQFVGLYRPLNLGHEPGNDPLMTDDEEQAKRMVGLEVFQQARSDAAEAFATTEEEDFERAPDRDEFDPDYDDEGSVS